MVVHAGLAESWFSSGTFLYIQVGNESNFTDKERGGFSSAPIMSGSYFSTNATFAPAMKPPF